ncbi:ATP-binding protein, partial [Planomonospora algeriensis]
WARAQAGAGGVVLLSGAPGSGKTSLARELAAAARAGGALVMSGKCDPDSSLPLAALRAAVEERLGAIAALAPRGESRGRGPAAGRRGGPGRACCGRCRRCSGWCWTRRSWTPRAGTSSSPGRWPCSWRRCRAGRAAC